VTGNVAKNLDYYALAHASRFVRPGADRIHSSIGTDGIETVAFQNADDHSIALIVLNGASQKRRFSIQYKNKLISHELPAASVMTLTWMDW
jgi:glucosylceramidase